MNHTVCHFEIPADDPEKLIEFCTALFGWTAKAWEIGEGGTYWLISTAPEVESVEEYTAKPSPSRTGSGETTCPEHHPGPPPYNNGAESLSGMRKSTTRGGDP